MKRTKLSYINLSRVNSLIAIGTAVWSVTMVKSGLIYGYGAGFWGPNGHDGIWHLALANSLSQGRLEMPVFGHAVLQNYHIGFDLVLAFLHRVTFIPLENLYFQILPPLMALSIGLLLKKIMTKWDRNESEIFWSLFFVYFGGNFGWKGESMFWSQQAISTLINPPFALSLIIILLGLLSLEKKKYLLAGVFFGALIQVKAYASVIVLGSLFLISIYEFAKKRELLLFKSFLTSLALAVLLLLPFDRGAGSLLELKPFWFIETMMSFPDRLGWTKFGEAMVNYKLAGNLVKGIPAYLIAIIIFWYGNMGTRFAQEIYWAKIIKRKVTPKFWELFLTFGIIIGFGMSLLFVQKGTAWNTIQFFYYSLFFSSILAGVAFAGIVNTKENKKLKNIMIAGVILLTVPTTLMTLKHYLPMRPPAKISNEEISALLHLESQPEGIVLTNLFDRQKAEAATNNPPRPLYLYESTAYVAAYTGKPVFLEDEVNLDITGFEWQERRKQVSDFFEHPTQDFLRQNSIRYLYLTSNQDKIINNLGLKVIFDSKEVKILEYE